jgi:hypothetical protein
VYTCATMYPCSFCFRFYRRIYEESDVYEYNNPSSTPLLSIHIHTVYVGVATLSSQVCRRPSLWSTRYCTSLSVTPDFKDKTGRQPYVCPGSQYHTYSDKNKVDTKDCALLHIDITFITSRLTSL